MIGVCRKPVKASQGLDDGHLMLDLPDFTPLKLTQVSKAPTRAAYEKLDHVITVVPKGAAVKSLRALPQGRQLERLRERAVKEELDTVGTRLGNVRGTGVTLARFDASTPFAALSWARTAIAESLKDKPATLGITNVGLDPAAAELATSSLIAAANAAAFELPQLKSVAKNPTRLRALSVLDAKPQLTDLARHRAAALGNNVARWFTALPPNELTAAAYRDAIATLAKRRSIRYRFLDEARLRSLGAGAFLAVSRGNATRDAGIVHLSYRPGRSKTRPLALVGKGVIFDTGGTNLKPFKDMLDMHTDMQGSAVALGTLLALAELEAPYPVDAWLALTENRSSATAYKPQDVVRAVNGTTVQIIHTDAEGRMVLADTLALAARERPAAIVDYATLTGGCITALTTRYSGVFSNRETANARLVAAGVASGERVWPFPMDDDFEDDLKSEIADVKQCSPESEGDHILAARFLSRFVPPEIPWVHIDLSAGQHKGGLGHVPTEIIGFGVRLTLEWLRRGPDAAELFGEHT
jgi:leucyl aminopeptidase